MPLKLVALRNGGCNCRLGRQRGHLRIDGLAVRTGRAIASIGLADLAVLVGIGIGYHSQGRGLYVQCAATVVVEDIALGGDYADRTKDLGILTEYVRNSLARTICQQYRDKNRVLHVVTLDPALEDVLAAGFDYGERGLVIKLSPQVAPRRRSAPRPQGSLLWQVPRQHDVGRLRLGSKTSRASPERSCAVTWASLPETPSTPKFPNIRRIILRSLHVSENAAIG